MLTFGTVFILFLVGLEGLETALTLEAFIPYVLKMERAYAVHLTSTVHTIHHPVIYHRSKLWSSGH